MSIFHCAEDEMIRLRSSGFSGGDKVVLPGSRLLTKLVKLKPKKPCPKCGVLMRRINPDQFCALCVVTRRDAMIRDGHGRYFDNSDAVSALRAELKKRAPKIGPAIS